MRVLVESNVRLRVAVSVLVSWSTVSDPEAVPDAPVTVSSAVEETVPDGVAVMFSISVSDIVASVVSV